MNKNVTKYGLLGHLFLVLTKLYTNINVIEVRICCRWWGESLYGLFIDDLLSCWARQTNSNRQVERPRSLRNDPAAIAFLWTATSVIWIVY